MIVLGTRSLAVASRPTRMRRMLRLLGELGCDALTIDAVAARAGSSETTIYRRCPDKAALVSAALVSASQQHPELPAGAEDLREDLVIRFVLRADGFDDGAQAAFVDHTLMPALKSHDTPYVTEGPVS